MSTHNIGFYEDLTKIIFELSSNTHLIFSADAYSEDRIESVSMVYGVLYMLVQKDQERRVINEELFPMVGWLTYSGPLYLNESLKLLRGLR